ncbi:MAG TPA: hypothetical protein GX724_06345 [Fibrobacter sp.]|nr:hypothetical protein [Fibrobacter sp.]
MELRKKPSILQRFLEVVFRLRLVLLLLSVFAFSMLFFSRNEAFSFLLGASESFSIKVNSFGSLYEYLPLLLGFIFIFLSRLFWGGVFSGFVFIGAVVIIPSLLLILDGSENVIITLLLWGGFISLLLSLLVRIAWVKALFPLYMAALLLSGLAVWCKVGYLEWVILIILLSSDALTTAWYAGRHLAEGKPKAGSLIQASLTQLPKVVLYSFLSLGLLVFTASIWDLPLFQSRLLFWLGYIAVFYGLFYPYFTFMPLTRLRSKKNRVKVASSSKKLK